LIPDNLEKEILINQSFIKKGDYNDSGAKLLINSKTNNLDEKKATIIRNIVRKSGCPAVMILP